MDPLYYLNLGPQNTFKASGELQSTPAQLDAIAAHLQANDVEQLTLHFHGGLVGEKAGVETAERLIPVYREAGTHPLVFIWESGLGETLKENLRTIHSTELGQMVLKFGLQKLESAFGQAVGVKGPGDEMALAEVEAELQAEDPFAQLDQQAQQAAEAMDIFALRALEGRFEAELQQRLAAEPDLPRLANTEAQETELLDPAFKDDVKDETGQKGGVVTAYVAKILAKILIATVKRFRAGTDHGVYPTLVEELLRELYMADLGAWVWSGMKNKAGEMWLPNDGPVTEFSRDGDAFLSKLAALPNPPALNLVGHSTGGIIICHLLEALAARYPGLHTRDVIFLAPGCRTDLFHAQVASRPERFERFRMFTMLDGFETQDRLVPGFYTRSLLYLVSGILEDQADAPLVGMVRYFSGQAPYTDPTLVQVRDFLYEPGRDRLALAVTPDSAAPGLRSTAASHGDFDNDPATLESIRQMLRS